MSTSTGACFIARAQVRPPKPAPAITTRGRVISPVACGIVPRCCDGGLPSSPSRLLLQSPRPATWAAPPSSSSQARPDRPPLPPRPAPPPCPQQAPPHPPPSLLSPP